MNRLVLLKLLLQHLTMQLTLLLQLKVTNLFTRL